LKIIPMTSMVSKGGDVYSMKNTTFSRIIFPDKSINIIAVIYPNIR